MQEFQEKIILIQMTIQKVPVIMVCKYLLLQLQKLIIIKELLVLHGIIKLFPYE